MKKDESFKCLFDCNSSQNNEALTKNQHKMTTTHHLRQGDILFQQDYPNMNIYYIYEGIIKIYSLAESGKKITHALFSSGDFVGVSAFENDHISPFTAEVIDDAKVKIYEKKDLFELFKSSPHFAATIVSKLTKAQKEAYLRNVYLINFKVRERVAKSLLELGKSYGEKIKLGTQIKLRLSREELASLIGIAPETAIRFLSEFKRKKYITESNHRIIILNQAALEKVFTKTCHTKGDKYEKQAKNCDENFCS